MYESSQKFLRFLRSLPERRLSTFVIAAVIGTATLGGCGVSFPVPTPPAATAKLISNGNDGVLIPLHVERSDGGQARLGLPVQLDGKAVYMAFDTGTQGVRVLSSVLPKTGYPAAGPTSSLTFANGAVVSGPSVKLPFSMVGTKPVELTVQTVTDVRCQRNHKGCPAMDGYTGEFGWAFSGILGAGVAPPDSDCCTQPLRALPGNIGQRYLVRANVAKPFVILSPATALTRDFTMLPMTTSQNGAMQGPPACVVVGDKMRFCAPVVFATGATEMIRVETGDGKENDVLAQGNYDVALGVGSWGHRYEGAQVTIAKAKPGANRIVIGLMAMQNLDVLFDFPRAQLGLRALKPSETLAP